MYLRSGGSFKKGNKRDTWWKGRNYVAQKKYWYKNTATADYLLLLSIMSIAGDMLMSFCQNEYESIYMLWSSEIEIQF